MISPCLFHVLFTCLWWQIFPQYHGISITLGGIVPNNCLFLGEVAHEDLVFMEHIICDDKAMPTNGPEYGSEFIKHQVRITPMTNGTFCRDAFDLTVKLNNAGFRLGQHVRIKYHNANSYWQRHYRPSELVGKRGYIVGCTPCYVHVAMGNVWSAYVNIIRKKNECVVLEYI